MGGDDKLVKAGVEAALKPFADLLEKLAGPAAEEIGLTFRDHVRVFRFKRQIRLFERVKEMLKESGMDAHRVPLKLLQPIIENASLEEDDNLQDKWAAFLANAAAGYKDEIHPSFVELLKQISAFEAQFLDALFSLRHHHGPRGEGKLGDDQVIAAMFPALKDELSTKARTMKEVEIRRRFQNTGLNLNLDRLGLVKVERMHETVYWYEMTRFGVMFVNACQCPKKESESA